MMESLFTSEKFKQQDFRHQDFGSSWDYQTALHDQKEQVHKVKPGQIVFLSGVHQPVYTLGRSLNLKKYQNFKEKELFVQTDRGGRVMYHGPGQLTLYPIFKLSSFFSGPKDYTCFLFEVSKDYLKKEHGVLSESQDCGLWVNGQKVGFVGLRISQGCVYHGLSLNFNVDLKAFHAHSPCDIRGEQVGNLKTSDYSLDSFKEAQTWIKYFRAKLTS